MRLCGRVDDGGLGMSRVLRIDLVTSGSELMASKVAGVMQVHLPALSGCITQTTF